MEQFLSLELNGWQIEEMRTIIYLIVFVITSILSSGIFIKVNNYRIYPS
jgi:hypothetical protein